MALYDYKADDGSTLTIERPMTNPPKSPIRRKGKVYYRDWSGVRTNAAVRPALADRHFACKSQPLWYPHAPRHAVGIPGIKDGTPLYDGPKEVRETEAKANANGERLTYDR